MGHLLTVTSGLFERVTGIHICTNHTGKMKKLWSLSITPHNILCEKRSRNMKSICSKCYSRTMQRVYSSLSKCLHRNMEILTSRILREDEMPRLSNKIKLFRFESFGDIINELQVVNYFHMAAANPDTHCALWTKNPWIIKKAMEIYGISKPDNLTIIGSSYNVNEAMNDYYKRYDFIDYIFTVYDEDYIREHHVDINCGGRSCRDCQRCYLRTHDGYEIREKLK